MITKSKNNKKRLKKTGKQKTENQNKTTKPGANRKKAKSNNRSKSKQGESKVDPALLVKKATEVAQKDFRSKQLFTDFKLHHQLQKNLHDKGFERPSEIQDKTIEHLIEGHDLLGIAQTGTGKTGAFLIPIIEQIAVSKQSPYALVVVPTRELATQVEHEFKSLAKNMKLFSYCFIGGTNINKDIQKLRRPAHVIIGTPGRLLDLNKRGVLDFRKFNTLVLDEFDRMLDMGFVHDVKRMIKLMRNRKQSLLFSATLNKKQQPLIDEILYKPKVVKVVSGQTSSDNIDQDIIELAQGEDKFKHLCDLISNPEFEKVLIFGEAKHRVNRLSQRLSNNGFKCDAIHGNKTQNARQRALDKFKDGKLNILVATDVAARGIDIDDITHVINFEMPMTYDSYIHRIGRTGRAGRTGKAFTYIK